MSEIRFIAPTRTAKEKMVAMLFHPFDIKKWFILGFSAWLATLLESGSSSPGGGGSGDFGSSDSGGSEDSVPEMIEEGKAWVMENLEIILAVGITTGILILAISIALTWVQARGKFMFLDNVNHDRALISEPWKQFKREANSLFWWHLGFGFLSFLLILAPLAFAGVASWPMIEAEAFDSDKLPLLIGLGVIFLILCFLFGYIGWLVENFVLPIMYRDRIGVLAAWSKFLPIHGQHFIYFIGFGIWMLILGFLIGLVLMLLVLGTCCIAAIPLAIPYVGTVVLLPMYVFYRFTGPEFLKQFGADYDVSGEQQLVASTQ